MSEGISIKLIQIGAPIIGRNQALVSRLMLNLTERHQATSILTILSHLNFLFLSGAPLQPPSLSQNHSLYSTIADLPFLHLFSSSLSHNYYYYYDYYYYSLTHNWWMCMCSRTNYNMMTARSNEFALMCPIKSHPIKQQLITIIILAKI